MGNLLKDVFRRVRAKWHSDILEGPADLPSLQTVYTYSRNEAQSIYSYCHNEFLRRQNIPFAEDPRYQYHKRVHELLTVYELSPADGTLCRVGKEYDGGYGMRKPFSDTPIAYSFGISGDVSWDKQMADAGYQIFQYDHTIKRLPQKNAAFHWKKLGITGAEETPKLKNLATLLKENGHADTRGMVLKMDVEGYEWDVFASVPQAVLRQFDQIVLELHDLTNAQNRQTKLKALEKLGTTHQVVHLHPNNNGSMEYCGDLATPYTMEATYILRDTCRLTKYEGVLPRPFDMPCVTFHPDVGLGYWNVKEG